MISLLDSRKCFNRPPASILTIFFRVAHSPRAKGCRNGGSANVRANLKDVTCGEPREVIDQEQNVHVQHRRFAPGVFQSMAHFSTAVFQESEAAPALRSDGANVLAAFETFIYLRRSTWRRDLCTGEQF